MLLIRYYGNYSFPKGHIEEGESREEAAIRETKEESGISVRILSSPIVVESQKKGDRRNVYFFPSLYVSGTLCAETGETEDAFWCDVDTALSLLTFDADKKALFEALRVVGVDIE